MMLFTPVSILGIVVIMQKIFSLFKLNYTTLHNKNNSTLHNKIILITSLYCHSDHNVFLYSSVVCSSTIVHCHRSLHVNTQTVIILRTAIKMIIV